MKKGLLYLYKKIEFLLFIVIGLIFLSKYIPVGKVAYLPLLSFGFPLGLLFLGCYLFIQLFNIKRWKVKQYLILAFFIFQLPQFFQLSKAEKSKSSFSIMTYNVKGFHHEAERSVNYKKIETFLNKEKPDILCLQEVHWKGTSVIHKNATTTNSTYTISSKYPIVNQGEFKIEGQKYIRNIFADIKIDTDTIRVYNIHLESYKFRRENYEFINNIDDYILDEKQGLKTGVTSTLRKLNYAYKAKAKQLHTLEQHILDSKYPVFLCGDFNDIAHSNSYNRLCKDLKDSFVSKGIGFGGTMNTLKLPLRIDYILYNDEAYKCLNHTVFREKMSDHHPIRADFTK
ncbi:MAG: endonuclease/exonuclease/phosphatase family protein [Flavobacteriales bacterium]